MLYYVNPRDLLSEGPVGWALLFFLSNAALIALLGFLLALFRPKRDRAGLLAVCAAAGAGALTIGLGSAFFLVRRAQRTILASIGADSHWSDWLDSIGTAESTYASLGISLFAAAILFAAATSVHAIRSRREGSRAPFFVPFTGALLVLAASTFILLRAWDARHPPISSLVIAEVEWLNRQGSALLSTARFSVLGIAAAASVVLLLRSRTQNSDDASAPSRSTWVASCTIGLLGLVAWIGARPFAHDGASPIPKPKLFIGFRCPSFLTSGTEALPRGSGVDAPCFMPLSSFVGPLAVLDFGPSGPFFDGVHMETPEKGLAFVQGKRVPFEDRRLSPLFIAAPASMNAADIAPWLATVSHPAQPMAVVMAHDQPAFVSQTVGPIQRDPRCSCPAVEVAPSGARLAGHTWDQIAKLAAEAPKHAPLVLSPGLNAAERRP